MINLKTLEVLDSPTIEDGVRFLKTQFQSNEDRFEGRWLEPLNKWLQMNEIRNSVKIIEFYRKLFKTARPFSYKEAMAIESNTFRAKVFSVIDVPQMIKNLGHKRISTEGIELKNKVWDSNKNSFKFVNLHQVYELHEINGSKLGILEPLYAIKCWCTSTDNEHWMWCNKDKISSPLEAIASCCVVYKPMIDKIKSIIRQGDVFLFEMSEEVLINESDEKVSLTKEMYFSLLTSQS